MWRPTPAQDMLDEQTAAAAKGPTITTILGLPDVEYRLAGYITRAAAFAGRRQEHPCHHLT